jgi:hypothetical protein
MWVSVSSASSRRAAMRGVEALSACRGLFFSSSGRQALGGEGFCAETVAESAWCEGVRASKKRPRCLAAGLGTGTMQERYCPSNIFLSLSAASQSRGMASAAVPALSEGDFHTLADATLEDIHDAVEIALEEGCEGDFDVNLSVRACVVATSPAGG